jgi:hypothetical protein
LNCTIFYRGKLKKEYTFEDAISIIEKHAETFECTLSIEENVVEIHFCNGKSEPLVLALEDSKLDGFCKWNGDKEEEYYRILDMFIGLKPLFKSYKVEDDFGIWDSYLIQNKPCKIVKSSISTEEEQKLLKRIIANSQKEYSDIEIELLNTMYHDGEVVPFSMNICRIIVQDFIELLDIKSLTPVKRSQIIQSANEMIGDHQYWSYSEENFTFQFMELTVIIWIGYCLSFKNKGIVRDLSNEIRGLESSKLAALYGIMSIFLNCHSGIINPKHAEINKFITKFTSQDYPFFLPQLGAKIELELLISILDYLGFKVLSKTEDTI